MSDRDEFTEALGADVVLPVTPETVYALRQRIVRLETAARGLVADVKQVARLMDDSRVYVRLMQRAEEVERAISDGPSRQNRSTDPDPIGPKRAV